MPHRRRAGFTLVEVAIVLVVIGLLLAGAFKGQELITNARVRGIIRDHQGVHTAYLGFLDRYRQPPGDYAGAAANIPGVSTACGTSGNGNGNGRVETSSGEYILAWEHLSKSGLLIGPYICTSSDVVTEGSVPRNPYGGFMQLIYDDAYAGTPRGRHNLKSGNNIPSDVLAEIDRKVDDANALGGTFRGSNYTTGAATDVNCWDTAGNWSAVPVLPNCGAAVVF